MEKKIDTRESKYYRAIIKSRLWEWGGSFEDLQRLDGLNCLLLCCIIISSSIWDPRYLNNLLCCSQMSSLYRLVMSTGNVSGFKDSFKPFGIAPTDFVLIPNLLLFCEWDLACHVTVLHFCHCSLPIHMEPSAPIFQSVACLQINLLTDVDRVSSFTSKVISSWFAFHQETAESRDLYSVLVKPVYYPHAEFLN